MIALISNCEGVQAYVTQPSLLCNTQNPIVVLSNARTHDSSGNLKPECSEAPLAHNRARDDQSHIIIIIIVFVCRTIPVHNYSE